MKRTLAIILSMVMLLGCLCTGTASAASTTAVLKLGGNTFSVPVKSTVTYTLKLKAPELIENGQFTVTYPKKLLAVKDAKMPNVDGALINYKYNVENEVRFNFSNYNGFDFTNEKVLINIDFEVRSAGTGEFGLDKELVCNLNDVNILDKCKFSESLKSASAKPELSAKSKSLKAGKTFTLKVKNTSDDVTFTSNKKSVATVSKNGVVTALKKGTAKITAKTKSGTKLTCTVSVTSSPKLKKKSIKVKVNKTTTVKITGKAKSVDNKYPKSKIAKVTSKASATTLKIKGLKPGSTTLKIKVNKKVLNLKVTVTK